MADRGPRRPRAAAWVWLASAAAVMAVVHRSPTPEAHTARHFHFHRRTPQHAQAAASSAQAPPLQTPLPLPLPATVDVDATRARPADIPALDGIIAAQMPQGGGAATANGPPPAAGLGSAANAPDGQIADHVVEWMRATRGRARAWPRLPVLLAPNSLGVYASRTAEGAAVCLRNAAGRPLEVRLRVRLPHGAYTVEALRLAGAPPPAAPGSAAPSPVPGTAGTSDSTGPAAAAPAARPAAGAPTLRRLQGRDLRTVGVLLKVVSLAPGDLLVVRYTDEAHAVRAAMSAALARLHLLAAANPGPARQLRRILREGEPYSDAMTWPARSGRHDRRLAAVHRLLLIAAQAQSLERNFRARGSIGGYRADVVATALDRLATSLSETSAVLLGVVADLTVGAPSPSAPGAPLPSTGITVRLANTGASTLSAVKLGVQAAAAGCTCFPADPAFFGEVPPGQAVTAEFSVRGTGDVAAPAWRADVSYFVAGAPAHLMLRPW